MNIIGRLTRDAQLSTLPSERQVVNFSIAVNDSYKNNQGERIELTEYLDCAYWISPKVAQFLTKGTLVELTGRVSARAWLGSDGEARASLNFFTSRIKFFGGSRKTETERDSTTSTIKKSVKETKGKPATQEGDDLPF